MRLELVLYNSPSMLKEEKAKSIRIESCGEHPLAFLPLFFGKKNYLQLFLILNPEHNP